MKESLYEIDCNQQLKSLLYNQKAFITSLGYLIRENCIGYIEKMNLHEMNFPFDLRCIKLQEIIQQHRRKGNELNLLELLFDRELVDDMNIQKLGEI